MYHGTSRDGATRVRFGDIGSDSSASSASASSSNATGGSNSNEYDLSDLVDVTVNVDCGGEAPGNSGGQGPGNNPNAEPEVVPKGTEVVVKDIPSSKPSNQGGFLDIFKK